VLAGDVAARLRRLLRKTGPSSPSSSPEAADGAGTAVTGTTTGVTTRPSSPTPRSSIRASGCSVPSAAAGMWISLWTGRHRA